MDTKQLLQQHFGSIAETARALGINKQAVWAWLQEGASIPAERCVEIERVTDGAVKREQLRPDLFGPV